MDKGNETKVDDGKYPNELRIALFHLVPVVHSITNVFQFSENEAKPIVSPVGDSNAIKIVFIVGQKVSNTNWAKGINNIAIMNINRFLFHALILFFILSLSFRFIFYSFLIRKTYLQLNNLLPKEILPLPSRQLTFCIG